MTVRPNICVKIMDASGEEGSFAIPFEGTSAANYDNVVGSLLPAIISALDAIVVGDIIGSEIVGEVYDDVGVRPNDVWAQREIKGQFTFLEDQRNLPVKISVPCLDLANVAQFGTDVLDVGSNALVVAYGLAVETHAVSRRDNALTLQTAKIIGVNN